MVPLTLEGPGAGSSPELPTVSQASFGRSEREEGSPGNWVAHFDSAQSREGLGGRRVSGLTYGPAPQVRHPACLPPGRVRQLYRRV
jgi:hypothetical protein